MPPLDPESGETSVFVHIGKDEVKKLAVTPTTTVKELLPQLGGKKLYFQRPDHVERPLGDNERPVDIQRQYLRILGYSGRDLVEEEGRDHPFLFRFRAGDWSTERDTENHDVLLGAGFLYHRRGTGLMKKWRLSYGELYPSKLLIFRQKDEEAPVLALNLTKAEIEHYHKRLHGFTVTAKEVGNDSAQAKPVHLAALSDLDKRGWFLRILNETRKDVTEVNLEQHMVDDLTSMSVSKATTFLNLSCNAVKLTPDSVKAIRHVPQLWIADNHLKEVPECLLTLPLEQLNISTNELKELPPGMGRMTTLKTLIAHTNLVSTVPPEFAKLKNLTVLVLSFNRFQEFPMVLCELPQLQQLSLAGNFIKTLPDAISVFEDLRKLILQRNLISVLPDGITRLRKLQQLDLSFNYIASLPCMNFPNLDFLSLTNNPVASASLDVPNATFMQLSQMKISHIDFSRSSNNIVHLILHKCKLKEFPDEVFDALRHIETFVVNHNKLKQLPKRVFAVRTLRFLSAGWNHLESLPELIENPSLHDIRVQANALTVLPAFLGKIINLRNLHASDNRLIALPKFDPNHNSMEDLLVGHNKLTDQVWDVLQGMPNLRLLDLSYNRLTELPENIAASSPNLEILNLTANNIGVLSSLSGFKGATQIYLGNNRLKKIPPLPPKISSLDASFNNIVRVQFDHPTLKHVDLSGNRNLELSQGDFSVATVEQVVLENMPHITRDYVKQRAVNVCNINKLQRMATHVMNYSGCSAGTIDFGTAEMQGVRPTNEDANIAMNDFMDDKRGLFCVFDGHAGDEIAHALRDNFAETFSAVLRRTDCGDPTHSNCVDAETKEDCIMRALRIALRDINTELGVAGKDKAGSTVVVTYLPRKGPGDKRDIYVANVGDAECVLALKDETVETLSTKHSTSSRAEEERIRASPGGFLNEASRVQGILATCRSLGDYRLYPYVSCLPDVKKVTVDDSANFLILACDGLWDVLTYSEAAALIRTCKSPTLAAHLLRDYAFSLGSEDNITVIVIHLRPADVEEVPALTRADSRKWAPSLSAEYINNALRGLTRVDSHVLEEEVAEIEDVADMKTDQRVETRALIYGITTDTHMASSYLRVRRDSLAPDELRLDIFDGDEQDKEKGKAAEAQDQA